MLTNHSHSFNAVNGDDASADERVQTVIRRLIGEQCQTCRSTYLVDELFEITRYTSKGIQKEWHCLMTFQERCDKARLALQVEEGR